MVNKSKAIGTEGENYVLGLYQRVWPDAKRSSTNNPGNDLWGVPLPTEIRRRGTWDVPGWGRALASRWGHVWSLVLVPRDRRLATAPPTMLVLPIEFGLQVLEAWDWARWSGWEPGRPRGND